MSGDPAFRAWLITVLDHAALQQDGAGALAAFGAACQELRNRGMTWAQALQAVPAALPALPALPEIPAEIIVPAVAAQRLAYYINAIERLEEEKADAAEDIREKYLDAKGEGFDTKTIRKVIAARNKDPQKLREEEELFELYLSALENAGVAQTLPKAPGATLRAPMPPPAPRLPRAPRAPQSDTSDEVGDRFAEVEGVVEATLASDCTSWEQDFASDMKGKLEEFGERTYVSEAQWETIGKLEERYGS